MTTGAGRDDRDPAGGPVPTRVQVARRPWLVPGLVVVVALAVVFLGVFGDKTVPRPPSPSISPSATASHESVSVAWTEIPLDPVTFDGAVVGLVVSGPRGVLALGQARTDLHPIAWTSEDGRAWVRTDLPATAFGGGVPDAAVQLSAGWVAVGYHATADGTSRDIWSSPDGVAWTRDPSATGRGFDEVVALAGAGRSAVLVVSVAGGGQALLSSRDGQVWAETPDLDATLGRGAYVVDAVASPAGYVAIGFVGSEPAIWRSPEGHDWARSDPPAGSLSRATRFQHVFRTADGLLVSGFDRDGGGNSAWVSGDGVAWAQTPLLEQLFAGIRTVLPLDGGNIGIPGDGSDAGQGFPVAWAGAGPWEPVSDPPAQGFDWGRQAAVLNGEVLVMAEKAAGGPIGAWLGKLDVRSPAAASPTAASSASGSVEASLPALPPVGRGGGPDTVLDWSMLSSRTLLNDDGPALSIEGVVSLGRELLAYGNDGYSTRIWLATDRSHWRLLPSSPAMRGGQVSGIAPFDGRVIAVGQVVGVDGNASPAVWTSADGESWKRAKGTGDGGSGQLTDVAAGPDGLVAVGWRGDGGTSHAIVWTSSDGLAWTSVTSFENDASTSQFNAIARGAAGYVAVGSAEGNDSPGRGVAWTSPDGRAWTRAEGGTAFAPTGDASFGDGSVSVVDVAAGDGVPGGPAFVAVGTTQVRFSLTATIFSSPDGRTWSRGPDNPALDGVELRSVVAWAGGLAAAGNVYNAGGGHPVIWTSADGVAWAPLDTVDLTHARSAELRDAFVSDLVAAGSGLVVVGGSFGAPEPLGAVVWLGTGPGEIAADHVCPAVLANVDRLATMTGADHAACIGARPVTVTALVRSELNDCPNTDGPPELSECGGFLYLAPLDGRSELLRIPIDRSLVDVFGIDRLTPWKLTLRADVVGPACNPVIARNGVVYQPPEAVHLQCRAVLRLLARERITTP